MVKSKEIVKIKEIENLRLRHFPLYKQTQFFVMEKYIFVELVRERKSSDQQTVLKKIAQIIYDMEKEKARSFLDSPLDSPFECYRRAYFVHSDQIEEDDHIDPGFTEIWQFVKDEIVKDAVESDSL